jgi:pseudaminic acid synthase
MAIDVTLGARKIGQGQPAYIVAELSGNHNGDLERALKTIRAAAEAGADAIKLQTYTADTLTIDCERPDFVISGEGPWAGRKLYDLYNEAHTPWEWHARLFAEAKAHGIEIFSTPFDETAVQLLESLGAPAYKVASFELIDDALLRAVGATGKPVIVSTGMASLEEIAHAVAVLQKAGCREIVILRCTSSYPAPDESMNLSTIRVLEQAFGCPVGLSDHSTGTVAPVVAVTLGACFIEKHFTLSRADGGVDSHFSLEPAEFREMVDAVRRAEAMVGVPTFRTMSVEEQNLVFRRSLFIVADIAAGEPFTAENVRSIRPGNGLHTRYIGDVLGRIAARDIARGTPLAWELITR